MDDLQIALGVLRDLLNDGGWIGWSEYGCYCNYCGEEIVWGKRKYGDRPAIKNTARHASDCAYDQATRLLAELDREPSVRLHGTGD